MRHLYCQCLVAALLLLWLSVLPAMAWEPATEDAVKAAMLHNFVKFVSWSEAGVAKKEPEVVLGVLGSDSLQEWLIELANHGDYGSALKTVQIESVADLRAHGEELQVLYIGRSVQSELQAIFQAIDGLPVLTVSDHELFIRKGGMVAFSRYNNRIRFDLNLDAAAKSRIKLSARLYGLARTIIKDGHLQEGR